MQEFEYTNRLKLPLLVPNQSGKEIFHNEALVTLDNLIQNCVLDKDLSTPPDNPNVGDIYIVGVNASKDWVNNDNNIAIYDNGWRFLRAEDGFTFFVKDENCFYTYTNNLWQKTNNLVDITELKNVEFVDLLENDIITYNGERFINTQDLKLKTININNTNKIESENNNLTVKYNNNENWQTVLSIDNTSGRVDFKNGISFNGENFEDLTGNNITINDLNLKSNTDLSNITQEAKDIITTLIAPDYTAGINYAFEVGTIYTVECNGWLNVSGLAFYGANLRIKLNGIELLLSSSANAEYSCNSVNTFYLSIGDTFEALQSCNNTGNFIFYPCKGNNENN